VLVDAAVDHAERVADRLGQLLGEGRGHHAAGRAHEQLVTELPPQLGQRVADRRLRQPQLVGHLRDAALDHQLLEQHQLVEIDVRQLHGALITGSDASHSAHSIFRMMPASHHPGIDRRPWTSSFNR
jgi:hypothetical protein